MNEHEKISALLPFYISGKLTIQEQEQVKEHIDHCAECIEELALWKDVSQVLANDYSDLKAPPKILDRALDTIGEIETEPNLLLKFWLIIRSQVPLVRKEIWPAPSWFSYWVFWSL